MLHILLSIFVLLFPFCQATGYVELRLKSLVDLPNATFHINYYHHWIESLNKKYIYDISLVANETRVVTGIPVNLTRFPRMFINTGPVDKYGFHRKEIDLHGLSFVRTITTKEVDLPFTGLRIERVCDRNWYGLMCNDFCNNDYAETIGRRCTVRGKVGCPLGFHGSNCDQPIDQEAPECQCQNGGICVSRFESPLDSKDDFFCECPIVWWSQTCPYKEVSGSLSTYAFDNNDGIMWDYHFKKTSVDNEFYQK